MTVAALPSTISYIEDGVTASFAAPFRFKAATDLMVSRYRAGVAVPLAYGVDYSATGGSTDAGGTLTVTAPGIAGTLLIITRRTARSQPMVYATNDRFPAKSHEEALDRLTLIAQEVGDQSDDVARRAITVPPGETALQLPPAAQRIDRVALFSTTGLALGPTLADINLAIANATAANNNQGLASAVLFQAAGAGSVLQTLQAKLRRIVDVDDYRQVADADDTASFVRAIAAIAATGGDIRLDPKKRYLVSSSITISSLFHIALRGGNFGQVVDATGPGIAYTAALASVFRAQAPGVRSACGGVTIEGISFYDASGSGGAPGSHTISAAVLDMYDAPQSSIENCQFHFVNGTVIATNFFVMSSIKGCRIRYSGAAGKTVLHLGATSSIYKSQSVVVHDCRFEVCYGDAYVSSAALTQAVTLSFCGFEASPDVYPASCVPFLDGDGEDYKIIGNSFNRNEAQGVILRGRGVVSLNTFVTGEAATESLYVVGSRNVVSANTFTDLRTGNSIRVLGVLNLIDGNIFYSSGGISLEGANNEFSDNIVDAPSIATGYVLSVGDYCTATGNQFNAYDFAATGYVPSANVASLVGAYCIFTQNSCRGFTGKTFIRVESATAVFQPNTHDGVGTFATTGVTLNTVASAAALALPYGPHLVTVTGTTNITSIIAGAQWAGLQITLVFAGVLNVVDGNNLKLAGNANFVTTADDTLTVACDGTSWFEIARSAN